MSKKGLTKAFLEEVNSKLTLLRYKKFNRSDRAFVKEISENIYAWIFINPARPYDGELEINPVVGVLHLPLGKLICEMNGDKGIKPSIGTHVGYLMPENTYIPLYITSDTINEKASELTNTVVYYAEKLAQKNLNLAQILDTLLNKNIDIKILLKYKVPAIYYLLGDYESCINFLEKTSSEFNTRQDPEAISYRLFEKNLKEKIKSIPGG